jgi:sulfur-carrier protein adenylyltransferase/sulfurtransferase
VEHPDLVGKASIIICATADWKSEQELNFRQLSGEVAAPIVYTWTEPNACASHAVLIFSGGPCLQCGFSAMGECKLQVTEWSKENKQQQEPACGAVFEPYGPIELLGAISATASLALDGLLNKVKLATHRIWAGPESLLFGTGGAWSKQWVNEKIERSKGGSQEDRIWGKDPLCDACRSGDIAVRSSLKSDNPNNASSSMLSS